MRWTDLACVGGVATILLLTSAGLAAVYGSLAGQQAFPVPHPRKVTG